MAAGMFRGVVRSVTAEGRATVVVPRLGRGHVYGPAQVLEGGWTPGALTGPVDGAVAGLEAHQHTAGAPLAAGDEVLVAFLEGRVDDLVILGRLT